MIEDRRKLSLELRHLSFKRIWRIALKLDAIALRDEVMAFGDQGELLARNEVNQRW